ncbi:MAG: shikimate kinase [Geobacteraceae bacterium]|nr:shikimate kinase [Geobacteraceae bacterium]
MTNIILTGFMGTGKSSVGKLLAKRLGYRFRDMDDMIVSRQNMSINEIFEKYGEIHFRTLEAEAIRSISEERGMVVSTGGGAVISKENRNMFRNIGLIVNLSASPEVILERLAQDDGRPLLSGSKDIATIDRLMKEREPFYSDADIRIDTTGKKLDDVAREILAFLEGRD